MSQGNVKCPVHGEHGALSNGQCWYCVQSGNKPPVATHQHVTPGTTRRIG